MRFLLPLAVLAAAGCDSDARTPGYTGPADYAYTLRVVCYCVYTGPVRVTVTDGAVASAVALEEPGGVPQALVDEIALTLAELTALTARAEREADDVSVRFDPTYGFPTELSVDWIAEAADDEATYYATDYVAL